MTHTASPNVVFAAGTYSKSPINLVAIGDYKIYQQVLVAPQKNIRSGSGLIIGRVRYCRERACLQAKKIPGGFPPGQEGRNGGTAQAGEATFRSRS
jgi:hypothetical protein